MKTAFIYKSVLGATKKYATWFSSRIQADLLTFRQATDEKLGEYDMVIVASGTYFRWVPLVNYLEEHWGVLANKCVIAIAIGSVPADNACSIRAFERIPAEIRNRIKYFKLPGRFVSAMPTGEVKKENVQAVIDYIESLRCVRE
ncbi:MAG: flavodoxin domain-containing protein [Patescibacteria group bacterium]|nr:flavodoxin domain-containing protein [Patescibacteria group bacterium]MDD5716056.1 flavodoxin domain-containing protein [Patescibacteria group bacterium]